MYFIAVILQSTLALLFRLTFAVVVLRIFISPFELNDCFFIRLVRSITEPVLIPARWVLSKIFGRFAIPYDLSCLLVLAVLSVLLIVYRGTGYGKF